MSGKDWYLFVDEGSGQRPATPEEVRQFQSVDVATFNRPVTHEYPKVVTLSGGLTVTAQNAEEEARWRAADTIQRVPNPETEIALTDEVAFAAAVPEPQPDPLADVSVEMDNPIYNEPKKKKRR